MREILISIRPKWIELIASGRKTVELRKSFPDYSGKVWVYSCSPVKKIVGWMNVERIVRVPPESLWRTLGEASCVTKEQFDSYYSGHSLAVGLMIQSFHPLVDPVPLTKAGLARPPQSWRWIDVLHLDGDQNE